MNRKISVGMAVTIVILAMTVTFYITMLVAMRLFDSTVNSVKEKESMYNKIAEVDRYVRSNDYYTIDETMLYIHVAEAHARDLPDPVREAGQGEPDPDRRVMRMIGARAALTPGWDARGKAVAKPTASGNEKGHLSVA